MSGFDTGLAFGYLTTRHRAGMSPFWGGYSWGWGLNQESVLNSPLFFSCYADLDRPSGFSSAFPSVDYAMNRSFYGGYTGFGWGGFGLLGGLGGFGYFC